MPSCLLSCCLVYPLLAIVHQPTCTIMPVGQKNSADMRRHSQISWIRHSQSKPASYLCFCFFPRFPTQFSTYATLTDSAVMLLQPRKENQMAIADLGHSISHQHTFPEKSALDKRMRGLIRCRSPRHTLYGLRPTSHPDGYYWSDWGRGS